MSNNRWGVSFIQQCDSNNRIEYLLWSLPESWLSRENPLRLLLSYFLSHMKLRYQNAYAGKKLKILLLVLAVCARYVATKQYFNETLCNLERCQHSDGCNFFSSFTFWLLFFLEISTDISRNHSSLCKMFWNPKKNCTNCLIFSSFSSHMVVGVWSMFNQVMFGKLSISRYH